MRAADRFDPERGYKFSTYSALWIRQAFQRLAAVDNIVRLPSDLTDAWNGAARLREPVTAERMAAGERWRHGLASLDERLSADGSPLHELVEGARLDVEQLDAAMALEALEQALGDGAALLQLRVETAPGDVPELAELVGLEARQLAAHMANLRRRARRLPAVAAALAG
jgi:hypothetical protein